MHAPTPGETSDGQFAWPPKAVTGQPSGTTSAQPALAAAAATKTQSLGTHGANSGHPGRDFASVMQWSSPFEKERIRLSGVLKRTSERGNGVRGMIVSSRTGVIVNHLLKPVDSIDLKAEIEVQQGETISFVVDSEASTDSDGYTWIPKIDRVSPDGTVTMITKSDTDFCGPDAWPLNRTKPQSPLSQLAQVLMMSNEFQFVD